MSQRGGEGKGASMGQSDAEIALERQHEKKARETAVLVRPERLQSSSCRAQRLHGALEAYVRASP